MSKVYRINCIKTGQCYIGSTSAPGLERFAQHFSHARQNKSSELYADMRYYDRCDFEFEVLEEWPEIIDRLELTKHEQRWIDKHKADGESLYNKNRAHDSTTRAGRFYLQSIKGKKERCECGGSYCPPNRFHHRNGPAHQKWLKDQLLHLQTDLFW